MILLVEQAALPDSYFYYGLSILLAGCIIWILSKYAGKTEKSIEKLTDSVQRLTTLGELHEHRITTLEEK